MTNTTALTKDDARAALKASAWTATPGLDDVADKLLAAVNAAHALCRDEHGGLVDTANVPVSDLKKALALAGDRLPQTRTIVHCQMGGFGADWDLDAALALVDSALSVAWSRSLLGHDLLVVGEDSKTYRFDVRMPEEA